MADPKSFDWLNPFAGIDLRIADNSDGIKQWAIDNRESIQPLKIFLDGLIQAIEKSFLAVPSVVMLVIIALIAWQAAGRRTAVYVTVALVGLGLLSPEAWPLAMTTLAIVMAAVILCVIIGLPLGIVAGKSDRFEALLRPVLDTMQTIPAFAVCPNEVNTPMLRTGFVKRGFDPNMAVAELGRTVPLGRIAEPEDIAEVVLFLASDAARYMCGSLVEVNGGKPVG